MHTNTENYWVLPYFVLARVDLCVKNLFNITDVKL